ncbi:MAG: cytochrome c peroxidase [Planctomycetota bacterium]|jgi:cytochrome c peroxidase|nr:cytochrome c peroxidase [Planctomycetota bacterium]
MAITAAALVLSSMMQLSVELNDNELRAMLSLSPPELQPPPPNPTNKYALDPQAAELGKLLFFKEGLAGANTTQSCASCHDPNLGWADGRQLAKGDSIGTLNTPTIRNSGFNKFLFWDGRADSLWAQAAQPIESAIEMHGSRLGVLHTINNDSELKEKWNALFGELPSYLSRGLVAVHAAPNTEFDDAWDGIDKGDQGEINRAFINTLKAIAAFERTVNSTTSNFDLFVKGLRNNDEELIALLSPSAQRGMKLFVSKGNCINCHFGSTMSDGQFHNIGLPPLQVVPPFNGRPDGIEKVRLDPFNGRNQFSDDTSWKANGQLLYMISNEHTVGAVKTPSLRDVESTAPYMHDGRFGTLEEVVRFYSLLPGFPALGHREETLTRLLLSDDESVDLVAFLKSLSSL